MPLVKVSHGLLEEENFFLTSPAIDFLGSGAWSRTASVFTLKSGEVLRKLPHSAFVIDVKKDPLISGTFEFFIEFDGQRLGIREDVEDIAATDWRILYYDGFVQSYSSADGGLSWDNRGGTKAALKLPLFQGFATSEGAELVISDYKVYRSPHLTILNFPPGSFARLSDTDGSVLERYFDENYECRFFLERCRSCSLDVFSSKPDADSGATPVFSSGLMDVALGDVFLFSSENLQLIYDGNVLGTETSDLKSNLERFVLRNAGSDDAHFLHIALDNLNSDVIELSFDASLWLDELYIDKLASGGETEFFLRKIQDKSDKQFKVKQFEIVIY